MGLVKLSDRSIISSNHFFFANEMPRALSDVNLIPTGVKKNTPKLNYVFTRVLTRPCFMVSVRYQVSDNMQKMQKNVLPDIFSTKAID